MDISTGSSIWETIWRHQPFTRGHCFLYQMSCSVFGDWLPYLSQRGGRKSLLCSSSVSTCTLSFIHLHLGVKCTHEEPRFGSLPFQCSFSKERNGLHMVFQLRRLSEEWKIGKAFVCMYMCMCSFVCVWGTEDWKINEYVCKTVWWHLIDISTN